jgi:hypothetical protein
MNIAEAAKQHFAKLVAMVEVTVPLLLNKIMISLGTVLEDLHKQIIRARVEESFATTKK